MDIVLNGPEFVRVHDPLGPADGWQIDEHRVTIWTGTTVSLYALPRRSPRIVLERLTHGRSRLIVGGFTRRAISVTGPTEAINRLREAVL